MAKRKLKVRVKPTKLKEKKICVKPTEYVRKGKKIKRRGYCYVRKPKVRRGYTYEREDIGLPGRGPKVIPPLKEGTLTQEVNKMGYERFKDVPDREIPKLARRLVRRFGCRSAFGKAQAQVVFRKRQKDGAKHKFIRLRDEIAEICRRR